jgi:hypothetical protein
MAGADIAPLQTRMQVVNPTPAAIYTGIGNAIATISRVEGYMSLWRGLSSVILGAGTEMEQAPGDAESAGQLTDFVQDLHMPYTSRRTRSSSKPWAAMPLATIPSQQVSGHETFIYSFQH